MILHIPISWVRTSNLRYVIFVVAPGAAKRPGGGGPSPGAGPPAQPGRKAFRLRRDGGVLVWELGNIQQVRMDKSCYTIRGICHAEFSILVTSGKSMLTAVI